MAISSEKMSTEPEDLQCILCNRCTHVCPQNMVNEKFSPRGLVLQLLLEGSVEQTDLWQCLTCLSCQDVCPQSTKWVDYVRDARTQARSEEVSFYCKHGNMLQTLQRMMSHESLQQDRLAWADGLQHASEGEYFYFTGCLPYFDNMFPEVDHTATAKATLKILNHSGITPVLSNDERCCGYESLWNGDKQTFQELLKLNLAAIEKSGATKVVTACAECFQTLSCDYANEVSELPFEVIHTAELFAQLLREGSLDLTVPIAEPITYHDPCRLGRYAKIYDQPRELLQGIPEVQFAEMEKARADSLCCGVGNFSNCDANSKFLQHERFLQAKRAGADVMVTACPKCRIHYSCYLDGRPLEEIGPIEVKDLSQVLADALD